MTDENEEQKPDEETSPDPSAEEPLAADDQESADEFAPPERTISTASGGCD